MVTEIIDPCSIYLYTVYKLTYRIKIDTELFSYRSSMILLIYVKQE